MNELLIFVELIGIDDLQKRAEKLNELTSGAPELRARVEELLNAHARASEFMATSHHPGAGSSPTSIMPHAETIGSVIGPYKLLQEIGEGGMGTVFMAEQSKPVQRRVALKIIKAGMDTRQVIARFEAERQALAIMDHPNIAKVLDAGATATGRPYFVMELVKGTPITKYCDEKQLSVKDRLELFIQVCQAIQHAHQKGIIHRDIKPTNVLVAQYDGKPVPKVIDFGVAKATAQKLTEKTMFTEFGMVIGTVEYMSPEQAEVNQLDIDTRSDVYSLGVLLYELLTGTTPLESKKLRAAAHAEMLRMIREEEPSRPSLKLSTSATLPSVAASRGVEPARLKKLVAGELDWIVMKTLEKERSRRYGSPLELGDDLSRYLNNEPILACPPSTWYLLRKSAVRHRALFVSGGVVVAGLLLGIVGLTAGLIQANLQRAKAIEAADREIVAREKAETAEEETLNAYRASMDDTIQQLIGSQENLGAVERDYLESAVKRWEEFANRRGDDDHTLAMKAEAWFQMGTVFESLGRAADAKGAFQKAAELRKKLVDFDKNFGAEREYARSLLRLGLQHHHLEETALADTTYSQANEIFVRLHNEKPHETECTTLLGTLLMNWGLLEKAKGQLKEAQAKLESANAIYVQWREVHPEEVDAANKQRISIHINLGIVFAQQKLFKQALENDVAAIEIAKGLLAKSPNDFKMKETLRKVRNNYAGHLNAVKRLDQAIIEFEACIAESKELAAQFPARLHYQSSLALTHMNLEIVYRQSGRIEDATRHAQEAVVIYRKLINEEPGVPEHRARCAHALRSLGGFKLDQEKIEEAREFYKEAAAIIQPLIAGEQPPQNLLRQQGHLHESLAICEMRTNRPAEALVELDSAIAVYDRISASQRLSDDSRFLAQLHYRKGICHKQNASPDKAIEEYRLSCDILEQLIVTHPEELNYLDDLGKNLNNLSSLHSSAGRENDAIACLQRSITLREELVRLRPQLSQYQITLGNTYANLAASLTNSDRPKEAIPVLEKGIVILSECRNRLPSDKNITGYLWNAAATRGKTYLKLKEYAKAQADFEVILELSSGESERFTSRLLIATAQLRGGDLELGMKNLLELQQQKELSASQAYNLACLSSIASLSDKDQVESLQVQAIDYLKQAVASGNYDRQKILDDKDFEPLRIRPDFMGLIAQLEAKEREKKAVEPQRTASEETLPQ